MFYSRKLKSEKKEKLNVKYNLYLMKQSLTLQVKIFHISGQLGSPMSHLCELYEDLY